MVLILTIAGAQSPPALTQHTRHSLAPVHSQLVRPSVEQRGVQTVLPVALLKTHKPLQIGGREAYRVACGQSITEGSSSFVRDSINFKFKFEESLGTRPAYPKQKEPGAAGGAVDGHPGFTPVRGVKESLYPNLHTEM